MARIIHYLLLCLGSVVVFAHAADVVEKFLSRSGHTNNWAVLVSTSRFWFNYRVCPSFVHAPDNSTLPTRCRCTEQLNGLEFQTLRSY